MDQINDSPELTESTEGEANIAPAPPPAHPSTNNREVQRIVTVQLAVPEGHFPILIRTLVALGFEISNDINLLNLPSLPIRRERERNATSRINVRENRAAKLRREHNAKERQ